MQTDITEIGNRIYRFSSYIPAIDLRFNQFLIDADEPLLFHCGLKGLFPFVSAAVARVMPIERLRWISFGHFEADESGTMNEWMELAPHARVATGAIGVMVSVADIATREPRILKDGEVLDLGGRRVRYVETPHLPHGWDAGVIYEETTETLFCGDLFTQTGNGPPQTEADIVASALATEDAFRYTSLTPATAPLMRRLGSLSPRSLALMHGPTFQGDGGLALRELADGYAARFQRAVEEVACSTHS
jgi:flavorubredoxin